MIRCAQVKDEMNDTESRMPAIFPFQDSNDDEADPCLGMMSFECQHPLPVLRFSPYLKVLLMFSSFQYLSLWSSSMSET